MLFVQVNGMIALKDEGKILGWVLKTCNGNWCYEVSGAATKMHIFNNSHDAKIALLEELTQIKFHTLTVFITGMALLMCFI